ncbi:MAG: hypothetical protein HY962_06505 [Ignavibacteriae bacterium]|nr:hypothetical protein [Ignavibacteriota bacterium]
MAKTKKTVKVRIPKQAEEVPATAKTLIDEMVAGGASKLGISRAVGVSNQTIMSVAQGKTTGFRKMDALQKVYEQWKTGSLDLKSQRGRRKGSKAAKASKAVPKKSRKGTVRKTSVVLSEGPMLHLPDVTEQMIVDAEKQIASLKLSVQFMKDVLAMKKKYGK